MPNIPIVVKDGSIKIAFDAEIFRESAYSNSDVELFLQEDAQNRDDPQPTDREVRVFSNAEARIMAVEITSAKGCGKFIFEPVDGDCNIVIRFVTADELATQIA